MDFLRSVLPEGHQAASGSFYHWYAGAPPPIRVEMGNWMDINTVDKVLATLNPEDGNSDSRTHTKKTKQNMATCVVESMVEVTCVSREEGSLWDSRLVWVQRKRLCLSE